MLRLLGQPGLAPSLALDQPPIRAFVAIAALVLLFEGRVHRTVAAEHLWPDTPTESALNNLRQLLSKVRAWERSSGLSLLHADRLHLYRAQGDLLCDVESLLQIRTVSTASEMQRALSLMRGSLLEGLPESILGTLSDRFAQADRRLKDHFVSLVLKARSVLPAQDTIAGLRLAMELSPYDERLETALAAAVLSTRGLIGAGDDQRVERPRATAEASAHGHRPILLGRRGELPRILILPPVSQNIGTGPDILGAFLDDLTLSLCRARTFAVFAPHTARQLAGQGSLWQVDRTADYALVCRAEPGRAGGIVLHVQFIIPQSAQVIFAERLELSSDTFSDAHLQLADALCKGIARAVERIELKSVRDSGAGTAYTLYLSAQDEMLAYDLPRHRRAKKRLQEALALKPDFAPALAALARCITVEWLMLGRKDIEPLEHATRFARQAIEIDPLAPDGYRELAHSSMYLKKIDESSDHISTAHQRAPHHADVIVDYADLLTHTSQFGQAKTLMTEALALNPIAPDLYYWVAGTAEFFLGDQVAAIEKFDLIKQQDGVYRLMSASYALMGDKTNASRYRRLAMSAQPHFRIEGWDSIVPFNNRRDIDYFLDALRLAGFK